MSVDPLMQARALRLPSREAMLRRDWSVRRFWAENQALLTQAWRQWDALDATPALPPVETLIDARLRETVDRAWDDPSTEDAVRQLWKEIVPGVFIGQFFDPAKLAGLRAYMDAVIDAQIPLRPPYGIALNRGGAMLDRRSEGHLAAPAFQALYSTLISHYMRPISRLLFPEVMGYDAQSFGFSIRYEPSTDAALRAHTDASSVTLNVNMNRPEETYDGSQVDFWDRGSRAVTRLVFEPGVAAIHRGPIPHATHPITAGSRSNLVLWLYGDAGRMPHSVGGEPRSAHERWQPSPEPTGTFAPF